MTLILTLSIGIIAKPMPSDLACNRALVEAQTMAARDYPGAAFVRAECQRNG